MRTGVTPRRAADIVEERRTLGLTQPESPRALLVPPISLESASGMEHEPHAVKASPRRAGRTRPWNSSRAQQEYAPLPTVDMIQWNYLQIPGSTLLPQSDTLGFQPVPPI